MFGPLPFVAVRQEHDEAAGPAPFRLAGGDELVDDDLRAVGEIAELGLPHDEHVGLVEGIAVIEAEHGGLGEQAVVDAEFGLVLLQVVEGDVAFFGLGVDQDGVALAEGAAAAVLAAQANGRVFPEQRADCQGLGEGPVDAAPGPRTSSGRLARSRASLGLTEKPGGTATDFSVIVRSVSIETPVSTGSNEKVGGEAGPGRR